MDSKDYTSIIRCEFLRILVTPIGLAIGTATVISILTMEVGKYTISETIAIMFCSPLLLELTIGLGIAVSLLVWTCLTMDHNRYTMGEIINLVYRSLLLGSNFWSFDFDVLR
jgi:hypothetical protein